MCVTGCPTKPMTLQLTSKAICLIDADRNFVRFLSDYLTSQGAHVRAFHDSEDFLAAPDFDRYDFYILDLTFSGIDGVDVVSLIKGKTDAGILIVTDRLGPDAFNSGLAAGADMFLSKPVRFDQIIFALGSIHRRLHRAPIAAKTWTLKPSSRMLRAPDGQSVDLTSNECKLLGCLGASYEPILREDLAVEIDLDPENRNLDAAMYRLRRKIEQTLQQYAPFKTVHNVGYQFTGLLEIV